MTEKTDKPRKAEQLSLLKEWDDLLAKKLRRSFGLGAITDTGAAS